MGRQAWALGQFTVREGAEGLPRKGGVGLASLPSLIAPPPPPCLGVRLGSAWVRWQGERGTCPRSCQQRGTWLPRLARPHGAPGGRLDALSRSSGGISLQRGDRHSLFQPRGIPRAEERHVSEGGKRRRDGVHARLVHAAGRALPPRWGVTWLVGAGVPAGQGAESPSFPLHPTSGPAPAETPTASAREHPTCPPGCWAPG